MQQQFGEFRIEGNAVASGDAYLGAVVVMQTRGPADAPTERVVFIDDGVAGRFRFAEAGAAARHAFEVGHRVLCRRLARGSTSAQFLRALHAQGELVGHCPT